MMVTDTDVIVPLTTGDKIGRPSLPITLLLSIDNSIGG